MRHQQRRIRLAHPEQLAAQRVDETIECFERHRLLLVAATREDERAVVELRARREVAHERRLADAGLSTNEHRAEPGARSLERGFESSELGVASEQELARGISSNRDARGLGAAEDLEHGSRRGSLVRIAAKERHRQIREIARRVVRKPARRLGTLLLGEDLRHRSEKWEPSAEDLVEHHAHRIEIRGRGGSCTACLLRRHVRDRPFHLAVRRRLAVVVPQAREAEVEEHDASLRRDDDVRRFDVAVDAPLRVQERERSDELPRRVAKPRLVPRGLRGCRRPRIDECLRGRDVVGRACVLVHIRGDRGEWARLVTPDPSGERLAVDELHRKKPQAVLRAELFEAHEVRVAQIRERTKLVLDPIDGVARVAVERLHRDAPARLAVARDVHHSHAAGAERALDIEARGAHRRHVHGAHSARRT